MTQSQKKFFGTGLPGVDPATLRGKLIVIEGSDGSGRTTHINLLRDWSAAAMPPLRSASSVRPWWPRNWTRPSRETSWVR